MSIKDLFPGYLGYEKEEIVDIWDNAVFFFDANSLLNFFEYKEKTFEDFVKVMTRPELNEKFHITYQAGLEFSRNKQERISKQINAHQSIKDEIQKSIKKMTDSIRSNYKNHSVIDAFALADSIKSAVDDEIKKMIVPTLQQLSDHHEKIEKFIVGTIGERISRKPATERLTEIYRSGKSRYELKIPPGYEDAKNKKEEDKIYGDLIIWLEMMEYCKENKIKSLIFITDDIKEDWWLEESGKTIGPRPELIQEMLDGGIRYYQYTSDRFLKYASEKVGGEVTAETIDEVKEVSKTRDDILKFSSTSLQRDILKLFIETNRKKEGKRLFIFDAREGNKVVKSCVEDLKSLSIADEHGLISSMEFLEKASALIETAVNNLVIKHVENTEHIRSLSSLRTIGTSFEDTLVNYSSFIGKDIKWVVKEIIIELIDISEMMDD